MSTPARPAWIVIFANAIRSRPSALSNDKTSKCGTTDNPPGFIPAFDDLRVARRFARKMTTRPGLVGFCNSPKAESGSWV
jgi:hypothetical protein